MAGMSASEKEAPAGNPAPYANLNPDLLLEAVEAQGFQCDGRLLALNSYENRVYQIGLEDAEPLIAKFYRPGRWSDAAIAEEHAFSLELAGTGLSVVAPLIVNGATLHHFQEHRLALFPRKGGHAPELDNENVLRHLGRVMGRIHGIGAAGEFSHRLTLTPASYGHEPVRWLLENNWIPMELETAFSNLCGHLLEAVDACWERAGAIRTLRLHGDCHGGNILWRDDHAHFVDLDDTLTGPAIQDLWMFLSGDTSERTRQISILVEEYRKFHDFDPRELHLVEALRTLRILHFNAWLAHRWEDPAFPMAFPWFEDLRHWETVINQLQEQLSALQEPPLQLVPGA